MTSTRYDICFECASALLPCTNIAYLNCSKTINFPNISFSKVFFLRMLFIVEFNKSLRNLDIFASVDKITGIELSK